MKTVVVTSRAPDARGKGDAKAADRAIRALRSMGDTVRVEALSPAFLPLRFANAIRAAVGGLPLQIGYSRSASTAKRVRAMAEEFDLVFAVHARAAAVIPRAIRRRSFAFIIDAYGQNYATYARALPPMQRELYRFEADRMRRFEVNLTREFGGVGVVSDYDRDYLVQQGADPHGVYALPGGADVEHFATTVREPDRAEPYFVFIGRLNYLPNRDAVNRLLESIWPAVRKAVPSAKLRVVGAQPGAALSSLLERNGVELAADVPDVRDEMRSPIALLVPMRLGGGIQSKILEAMAARLPVICSGFANLGIRATPGEHLLIADSPEEFAAHASRLATDPGESRRLAESAYAWVLATQSQDAFTGHLAKSLQAMLQRV